MFDIIVIGAGPCGLSAAIECKQKGMRPLLIERYHLVSSIYRYPTFMVFHSTPELLEIGGLPFSTPNEKPTRQEGLAYYRKVADYYGLDIQCGETVVQLEKLEHTFEMITEDKEGIQRHYRSKRVVVATGYFDQPNRLEVPGEELTKVSHYYTEGHPYYKQHVAVIGGRNNALEAALDLYRSGAKVSLIYRGSSLRESVKAWIKPVFESAVDKGWIQMYWNSNVLEIRPRSIVIEREGEQFVLENDAVFALIGYKPHHELLVKAGVRFDSDSGVPVYQPETMETNIEGLYIAGVAAGGQRSNDIFIENGRHHGVLIAKHVAEQTQ